MRISDYLKIKNSVKKKKKLERVGEKSKGRQYLIGLTNKERIQGRGNT